MNITHTSLLQALVTISREAGKAILDIYNDEARFARVDFKADDSPLTLADKAAHMVIDKALKALTPDIPVLSEEGKHLPFEERKNWNQFWLVDPLDGTKEFVKRNGEFTVNIALVEDGSPVMGCVYVPVTDTAFYAAKGDGAFVARMGEAPANIQVDVFDRQKTGVRIVASRSHMSPEVEAFISDFDQPETVAMGSSLKFMLVAEGKADIYPRLAPTMEWDTGAAQIIVEEAGGTVVQAANGQPLIYNKENLLNPHFIVWGGS